MTGLADLAKTLRAEMGRRNMLVGQLVEQANVPASHIRGVLDGRTVPVMFFRRLSEWAAKAAAEAGPKARLERAAETGLQGAALRDRRVQDLEERVARLEARLPP